MTPERKLELMLGAAEPRTPDYVFMAEVAEGLARRRAWRTVLNLAPWSVVATLALWGVAAVVEPMVDELGPALSDASMPLGAAAVAGGLSLLLVRRFTTR